jgi:hypothetical protein
MVILFEILNGFPQFLHVNACSMLWTIPSQSLLAHHWTVIKFEIDTRTTCSWSFLKKPLVAQLLKNFPTFLWNSVHKSPQRSLSWARSFSSTSYHFIPLRSKNSLQHQFSNTRSLCSSLNVREQVSHPYKTTGKIIVLYVLILMF